METDQFLGKRDHSQRSILKLAVERGAGSSTQAQDIVNSVVGTQSLGGEENEKSKSN